MNEPKHAPDYKMPTDGMESFQSIKRVLAGEITEVVPAGCYVKERNGDSILRIYPPNMTARYTPAVGDFWVIYEPEGYQSISPRAVFLAGYVSREASVEDNPERNPYEPITPGEKSV